MPSQKPISQMTEAELIKERARLQNRHRGMIQSVYGHANPRHPSLLEVSQMEFSEQYSDARHNAQKTIGLGAVVFIAIITISSLILVVLALVAIG